jgi:membrane protein DedA with SNARE-associated domain
MVAHLCYTVPMDLHLLITEGSYAAIFFLMTLNGAINLPSSQILYLIVGYFIAAGKLEFIPAIIAGSLGNTIGNIITFLLIRKYERPLARKILMMNEETFAKIHTALHETFSKRGMLWLFIGKLTPSIKAFIPIVAGLAETAVVPTSAIFLFASLIWATGITYIGFAFGEHVSLSSFLSVSLIIGFTILFFLYRTISKQMRD